MPGLLGLWAEDLIQRRELAYSMALGMLLLGIGTVVSRVSWLLSIKHDPLQPASPVRGKAEKAGRLDSAVLSTWYTGLKWPELRYLWRRSEISISKRESTPSRSKAQSSASGPDAPTAANDHKDTRSFELGRPDHRPPQAQEPVTMVDQLDEPSFGVGGFTMLDAGSEEASLPGDTSSLPERTSTPDSASCPAEPAGPPLPYEATIPLPLPPTDPVLNDRVGAFRPPNAPSAPKTFSLFPNLPAELRLRVWFSALERHRFIRIYITWVNGPVQRYNVHKGLCDGHESRRFPTTLLAVNSEARCAAREFYRVQLPCVPKEGSAITDPVLYLNPEWDFLRLFSTRTKTHRPHGVLEFLHDVKQHDPKGVGVLNVVIGKGMLKDLTKDDCAALRKWESPTKAEMPALLSSLRTVYFSQRDRDKSRLPETSWGPTPLRNPLQPVFARPTEFHLVGPDPRNIASVLTELWTCDGPRAIAKDWRRLTGFFGVNGEACGTVHRHMISLRPEWKSGGDKGAQWVHDREDLEDLLRVDADRLDRMEISEASSDDGASRAEGSESALDATATPTAVERQSLHLAHWRGNPQDSATASTAEGSEEARQVVERVAGFWLLPTEAFKEPVDRQAGMYQWNVSAFTPELGAFKLPDKAGVRW